MPVPMNPGPPVVGVFLVEPHDIASQGIDQQVDLSSSERRRVRCGNFQCLILSSQNGRREMLNRAAEMAGWEPIVCLDADAAHEQIGRMFLQLAIVDMVPMAGREPPGYRDLAEKLARLGGLLLVICGNEGRPQEEIWARQLGAWLYLPGVVESDDVAMLCGEARQIAEQLRAPQRTIPMKGVDAPRASRSVKRS
jgi:hypothetical protein